MGILLVGEHTPVAATLESMLTHPESYSVTRISFKELVSLTPKELTVKVIIAELTGLKARPVDVITAIKKKYASPPLLVLHNYENERLINPLLQAGADAYLQLGAEDTEKNLLQWVHNLAE